MNKKRKPLRYYRYKVAEWLHKAVNFITFTRTASLGYKEFIDVNDVKKIAAVTDRNISRETMPNDNDLVVIPREEYEQLLQYKEAYDRMLDARIYECKVKMQMMEMDTMINQAMPPYQQVLPLKGLSDDDW